MLKIYNAFTRKKEKFQPLKDKKVGLYSCGPTVYWYQHIGNLRTYIFTDILRRTLVYSGYQVKQIMNVTDVGHLTSDADEGEDKIEKAAKKEGKTAKDITNYYWKVFKEDLKELNILEPDVWPKATEHIKEQIDLIKKLEEKGYTYKTNDGIYFDTSKFKNYGKLARLKKESLRAGKRIEMREKKNPTDFALWKFSPSANSGQAKRQQEWPSPWGVGFPGWHVECSAMAMKYLGESFDIHTGGEDHVAIHHTNEIAQSEAATGKKFVNYWLHGAFLTFRNEKVSKSKGGLYTISELKEKGFPVLAFRYLCLTSHYRTPLDFSLGSLEGAKNSYERLKNIISELKNDEKINKKYLKEFEKAINDDLDMPKALAVLWKMLRDKKAVGRIRTIKEMDKVLGLDLFNIPKPKHYILKAGTGHFRISFSPVKMDFQKTLELPENIKKLAVEREKYRKEKNWQRADEIRQRIKKAGYEIEDTSEGPKIKKT